MQKRFMTFGMVLFFSLSFGFLPGKFFLTQISQVITEYELGYYPGKDNIGQPCPDGIIPGGTDGDRDRYFHIRASDHVFSYLQGVFALR